ncbi:hypothetical protein DFQ26_008387 [Actinomortierella ambigua]|nr:hypothetical protein DFQ26_008387 [Actinomortierella ambigua]
MSAPPAGWEALNERQTGLLLDQKQEIELVERGILDNAKSLLGPARLEAQTGLANAQTLSVFRDKDRWKALPASSGQHPPVQPDLFKSSTSWSEIRNQLDAENRCDVNEKPNAKTKSPTASRLDYQEMKTYGGQPMADDLVVMTCNHCNKPMIPSAYRQHRLHCKQEEPDSPEIPLSIQTDLHMDRKQDSATPKTKKRKESVALEEPVTPVTAASEMSPPPPPDKKPSEKKQKTAKPVKAKATGRVKGPLDLDKQCGVIAIPGGNPCTRSLTCKSHSMSAKRAVQGRSQPYDVLLGFYHKKPAPVKAEDKIKRIESEAPQAEKEDVNLDSDEEFNDLLEASRSSDPQPVAMRPMSYVRRRNNCLRIRDLLLDALKGPCRPMIPNGSSNDQPATMHL